MRAHKAFKSLSLEDPGMSIARDWNHDHLELKQRVTSPQNIEREIHSESSSCDAGTINYTARSNERITVGGYLALLPAHSTGSRLQY